MSAALANVIAKRSRDYVIERRGAVTTDPLTGLGTGGAVSTGTLRCHIQPYDGPARVDNVSGTDTTGRIKIWVADSAHVILDDDTDVGELRTDPGEGGTGAPGDVVVYDGHRWLVIERSTWSLDGSHHQYLARDKGAAT
jgi:hypothetical protein